MLTLGLMEGAMTFAALALIFLGATNANLPLHRIFGPPVMILLAIAGYAVWDMNGATGAGEVFGLLSAAFFGFLAPLAVMRYGWRATKLIEQQAARAAPRVEVQVQRQHAATIHVVPAKPVKPRERHHRHAA